MILEKNGENDWTEKMVAIGDHTPKFSVRVMKYHLCPNFNDISAKT